VQFASLRGIQPFDDPEWVRYDYDEEYEVEKEVKCQEGDEGAESRWVEDVIEIEAARLSVRIWSGLGPQRSRSHSTD